MNGKGLVMRMVFDGVDWEDWEDWEDCMFEIIIINKNVFLVLEMEDKRF